MFKKSDDVRKFAVIAGWSGESVQRADILRVSEISLKAEISLFDERP